MAYKKFVLKLFIFSLPFFLVLFYYIYKDPFKTIFNYDYYYRDNSIQGVILNRDFVSFETFLNNNVKFDYDSFILGNSRSIFFKKNIWAKYISSDSEIFHFDASGESIYGVEAKLRFLDDQKVPIKNAIIVIDPSLLIKSEDDKGFLLMKHYSLSGKNRFAFELEFFKAFLNIKFFTSFLYFQVSNRIEPFMKKFSVLDDRPMNYDLRSNEISFSEIDSLIQSSPEDYYTNERMSIFYNRGSVQIFSKPVIDKTSIELLIKISTILNNHKTNFKIVISPLYDQVKINSRDLYILNSIFNKNNVFDFSGINKFTNDYHNYYETSHYRPIVAEEIMNIVY
jgi:hypothetical protein